MLHYKVRNLYFYDFILTFSFETIKSMQIVILSTYFLIFMIPYIYKPLAFCKNEARGFISKI